MAESNEHVRVRPALAVLTFAALLFLLLGILAVLDRAGLPASITNAVLVLAALAIPVGAGLVARTLSLSEFLFAGRRVPPGWQGLALAGSAFGGVYFLGLSGPAQSLGRDGLAFLLGPSAGLFLMMALTAPTFRASAAVTVPDLLAIRYGGLVPRLLGTLVLVAASLALLIAELSAAGLIGQRLLGYPPGSLAWAAAAAVLTATLFGGMRALTHALIALYLLVASALFLPIVALYVHLSEVAAPAYGAALEAISAADAVRSSGSPGFLEAFSHPGFDRLNFACLVISLAAAVAALPHLLGRAVAASTSGDARRQAIVALLFLSLLFAAVPLHAAFSEWIAIGAGIPAAAPLPVAARMPAVIEAVFIAGGLAAALAAAAALLHTLSVGLGHDFFLAVLDRDAQAGRRLIATRIVMVGAALLAALAAGGSPDPLRLAVAAVVLTAAALFPSLALVSWRRATPTGAVAAIAVGLLIAVVLLAAEVSPSLGSGWLGMSPVAAGDPARGVGWLGIGLPGAAVFGLVAGFAVLIGAALVAHFRRPRLTALPDNEEPA